MVRVSETAVRRSGAKARNGRMVLEAPGPRPDAPVKCSAHDSKGSDPRGVFNKMCSVCQLAFRCRRLMATVTVHRA